MRRIAWILAVIVSASPFGVALADRDDLYEIPRSDAPYAIDGRLDDAVWAHATVVELVYETSPSENIPALVRTEALLVETGSSLLVGFRAFDPEPDKIRAYLRDRDSAYDDDFVGIVLDTFNDERRALEFFANSYGAQMDLIQDDVNGREDDSWDAIWSSAGEIHADGYTVEMELPFRTLRFPATDGEALTWGVDLLRFYPRDVRHRLSNNRQDRDVSCYLCQISKMRGMAGASPGRNLEVVPTLTVTDGESRSDPLTEPLMSDGTDYQPGLDVRWGITPDISFSGTLNPDFSQIEADAAQVSVNNQFALFFPEKRPFFLEGQDTFSTYFNVVHTRNVADPDVGLKLTGKTGDDTFGVFAVDDSVTNILIPGPLGSSLTSLAQTSNNLVGRYRRDVGDNSTVGVVFTGRESTDYYNYVFGVDTQWRLGDSTRLRGQLLRSDTEYPGDVSTAFGQPDDAFGGTALAANLSHNERDWSFYSTYTDVSDGFRADLGFIPQVGYEKLVVGGSRRWYPEEGTDSWWNRIQVSGDVDVTRDQQGRMLEREFESYSNIRGPMQSYLELGVLDRERLWDGVYLDERWIQFYGEFQPRRGMDFGIFARKGDQIDLANSRIADVSLLEPRLGLNLGPHLELDYSHVTQRFETNGQRIFTVRLDDLRLTYQFSIRSFLRLTLQQQDVTRDPALYVDPVGRRDRNLGSQLLYSYKLNPQTVFFLGYSDAAISDDVITDPEVVDRALFMKLSYAWIPD